MKILLLGEFSNVHWTLAEGLRALGHHVTVASDGDFWKGYPRDIDLKRKSLHTIDTLRYLWQVRRLWPQLRGYDVVQLINPIFLDLTAQRILPYYKRLRQQNGKVVLGAFGIDHYWVLEGMKPDTFRYSDFYLYGKYRENAENDVMLHDWLHGEKGRLNQYIARDCDAIVTGLYEYDVCYQPHFPDKTHFIPFPINLQQVQRATPPSLLQGIAAPSHAITSPSSLEGESLVSPSLSPSTLGEETCTSTTSSSCSLGKTPDSPHTPPAKIRFFIGIQKTRNAYKGTDIMLRALERLQALYPDRMEIVKAESVPFAQYQEMMNTSHVLLDQLYSYTPGMNGLLAMAKGIVLVGGGEEEQYHLIQERELRPIINVQPTEEDVMRQIENRLLSHPEDIPTLAQDSITYVQRHHDHIQIAKQYEQLYQSL